MSISRTQAQSHLQSLYAAASLLKSTEADIRKLVDDVLEQTPPDGLPWPSDATAQKEMLLAGLVGLARTQEATSSISRAQVEQFVSVAVPEAFLHLSQRDQLILLFTYRDELDAETIGRIFGLDTFSSGDAIQSAHSNLYHQIQRNLETNGRRGIVGRILGDRWIIDETRRYLRSIHHVSSQPSETAASAPRQPTVPPKVRVERPSPPDRSRKRYRQALGIVAAIFAIGFLGYLLNESSKIPEETDFISLVATAATANPGTLTSANSPDSIASLIHSQTGSRYAIPELVGYRPEGVKLKKLKENVRVPMIYYEDGPTLVATNYSALASYGNAAQIDDGMLRQLSREDSVVSITNRNRHVYTWRHRDDILLLVSTEDLDTGNLFSYD